MLKMAAAAAVLCVRLQRAEGGEPGGDYQEANQLYAEKVRGHMALETDPELETQIQKYRTEQADQTTRQRRFFAIRMRFRHRSSTHRPTALSPSRPKPCRSRPMCRRP